MKALNMGNSPMVGSTEPRLATCLRSFLSRGISIALGLPETSFSRARPSRFPPGFCRVS